MQKFKLLAGLGIASVFAASVTVMPALAWHPKGQIVKRVQNVTTGSPLSDANTTSTAVMAKPGDTLRYVIEVSNVAAPAGQQHNDMDFVVMTDDLPAGVELTSQPSKRQIRENLGLIVPQKKVVKEYEVKVTSNINNHVITNEACFTGDSVVKDNPQSGCDKAIVKITVPEQPKPEQPKPEQPKPETPQPAPEQPKTLPQTGMGGVLGAVAGTSILGFAGHAYMRSKQSLKKALRK